MKTILCITSAWALGTFIAQYLILQTGIYQSLCMAGFVGFGMFVVATVYTVFFSK